MSDAMPPPVVCVNCGYWQRQWIGAAMPARCPVCEDFRHTPPPHGYCFLTAAEMSARTHTTRVAVGRGVVALQAAPALGIGPRGYVVRHPAGSVVFDNADWYDDAALAAIAASAPPRWLAASHPHAYAALWRLQERFQDADVALAAADLAWSGALRVTWPVDERLQLAPGLTLLRTGGHFDGHTVLHWADGGGVEGGGALFAGDLVKFHYDAPSGEHGPDDWTALSTHKAYNRQVPMSHAEIRRYREVVAPLAFDAVHTSFDTARCGPAALLALFDRQLAGRPFAHPAPRRELETA